MSPWTQRKAVLPGMGPWGEHRVNATKRHRRPTCSPWGLARPLPAPGHRCAHFWASAVGVGPRGCPPGSWAFGLGLSSLASSLQMVSRGTPRPAELGAAPRSNPPSRHPCASLAPVLWGALAGCGCWQSLWWLEMGSSHVSPAHALSIITGEGQPWRGCCPLTGGKGWGGGHGPEEDTAGRNMCQP